MRRKAPLQNIPSGELHMPCIYPTINPNIVGIFRIYIINTILIKLFFA